MRLGVLVGYTLVILASTNCDGRKNVLGQGVKMFNPEVNSGIVVRGGRSREYLGSRMKGTPKHKGERRGLSSSGNTLVDAHLHSRNKFIPAFWIAMSKFEQCFFNDFDSRFGFAVGIRVVRGRKLVGNAESFVDMCNDGVCEFQTTVRA
jgi:hypothetical protein